MNDFINKLLDFYKEEDEVLEKIINIDNKFGTSNYSYDEIYNIICEFEVSGIRINKDTLFITDGDIKNTLNILCNMVNEFDNNAIIYICRDNVGINKWLVSRYNEIVSNNVSIDTDNSYDKYIGNNNYNVFPIGNEEFIMEVSNDFNL